MNMKRKYVSLKVTFLSEVRSYKGLAPESMFAGHPKLDVLQARIIEWLKGQGFRVVKKSGSLFARKGPKKQARMLSRCGHEEL